MPTSTESIQVPYGDRVIGLSLPVGRLKDQAGMSPLRAAPDPGAVVAAALNAPIGSPRLEEIARSSQNVVVVVDDLTRPTPVHLILPGVLERLHQAGVSNSAITVLIATGTHRPMSDAELRMKLGGAVVENYKVVNHDYRRHEDLVQLGNTPSGIPITINRTVVSADLVIGIGNIVPHRYCGWAGGAKIIQPGVGGEATTAATHLMITKDPGVRLGVVENRVRNEIESVADLTNLKFIVNTILDPEARVVDVVAGDFRKAFREGVEKARAVYTCDLTGQADVVVASSHPSDLNFWQAGKGLYAAEMVVSDGGIIVLASPCYEGVGEHGEFVDLLCYDYRTLDRMIADHHVKDRIGAAAALAVALVKERAEIWLVAQSITDAEARHMQMRRFGDLQAAVDTALEIKGPSARVTVLREAAEIVPRLPS